MGMLALGKSHSEIAAHYGLTAGGRDIEQELFAQIARGGHHKARAEAELWLRQLPTIVWYFSTRLTAINQSPRQRPLLWEQLLDQGHYAYQNAVRSYKPNNPRRHTFNKWLRGYLAHAWTACLKQEDNRMDRYQLDSFQETSCGTHEYDHSLAHLPEHLRVVATLLSDGHEFDEIAAHLGYTSEAMEEMIAELRACYGDTEAA